MTSFELLPEGGAPTVDNAETFVWPRGPGATPSVAADTGAWLGLFGVVPTRAIDLVRIAAAAYMADRRSGRGQGFTRTIDLHVQLVDSEPWADVIDEIADLLFWMTGDTWNIGLSDDDIDPPNPPTEGPVRVDTVALLSGGLDSFSGAVLAGPVRRLFLGHSDNTIVRAAQNAVENWLAEAFNRPLAYEKVKIVQVQKKVEASSRSRSFLFMALGVAAALARGAGTVEVPENGYTSLNPPLGPERGGALSTRSTHPLTIARVNALLSRLDLGISITDPYAHFTKGQLIAHVAGKGPHNFSAGAALTLSCGKLDGRVYRGGNPNFHCGLCFPCIVRRGAFASAGVADATTYLSNTLTGDALAKLRRNRSDDVVAVKRAIAEGFNDATLIAMGRTQLTLILMPPLRCVSQALQSWTMSTSISAELPPIDCHAHIAPDVTLDQLRALGEALIFAVTRSLDESEEVIGRTDSRLIWGCGVHPGVPEARAAFDESRLRSLIQHFVLIGEVGLDRRAGQMPDQIRVFRTVLATIEKAPVVMSVHSAGCADSVVDLVCDVRHPGVILHWFLGDSEAVRRAANAGCYFSVNGAMSDDAIRQVPLDRMLPETDFPGTARRRGGRRPGDTTLLERRLTVLLDEPVEELRWRWYRNLRALALASGTLDRLPIPLADRLLQV